MLKLLFNKGILIMSQCSQIPATATIQIKSNLQACLPEAGCLGNRKVMRNMGYIPLVGIIAGIARLIDAYHSKNSPKERMIEVLRGFAEIFFLGPIIAIFDAIINNKRSEDSNVQNKDLELNLPRQVISIGAKAEITGNKKDGCIDLVKIAINKLSKHNFKHILLYNPSFQGPDIMFEEQDGQFKNFNFRLQPKGSVLIILIAAYLSRITSETARTLPLVQPKLKEYINNGHQIVALDLQECQQLLSSQQLPEWLIEKIAG
jgi:hypothetical protein